MGNRLIIGAGGCGFLRINHLLNSIGIPTKYKGGRVKFQNSFETWNPTTGLVWNAEKLSESDRIFRANHYLGTLQSNIDIAHYPLKYIKELISIDSKIKILCIKPRNRNHSVRALFYHWAYRSPVATKRNEYRARYVLDQFPDYSHLSYLEAAGAYWDEYYTIAEQLNELYPNNFIILDSIALFIPSTDNGKSRKILANFFENQNIVNAPIYESNQEALLTTALHGGLGNNLFQMAESIAFSAQHNLLKPVFGTWKLQGGGRLFLPTYNADVFLGKHTGTHQDFISTFKNIEWKTELNPTFDTKFMINDMFDFCRVNHMRESILDAFEPTAELVDFINEKYCDLYSKETVSLHLRTCTLPADDHVNDMLPFSFFKQALDTLPNNVNILVFSDNNQIAKDYIMQLQKVISDKIFYLIEENQFKSIFMMAKCNHHILHVSTMSFWGAYLDKKQSGKTFYHENFEKCHTDRMIPKSLNWIKL